MAEFRMTEDRIVPLAQQDTQERQAAYERALQAEIALAAHHAREQAEPHDPLLDLQERHHFEITRAFREFRERWRNIFTEEETRWYQAGKAWKLAQEPDGHLSWKPYAKSLDETVEDYRHALVEMQARVAILTHENGLKQQQGVRY